MGGGGGLRGLSQEVQLCTGAQINVGDLTPYLTLGSHLAGHPPPVQILWGGIFKLEPRNRFQGMNSASLCSLAGRYDIPIPTRFLAPIDCLKIPAQVCPLRHEILFYLANSACDLWYVTLQPSSFIILCFDMGTDKKAWIRHSKTSYLCLEGHLFLSEILCTIYLIFILEQVWVYGARNLHLWRYKTLLTTVPYIILKL